MKAHYACTKVLKILENMEEEEPQPVVVYVYLTQKNPPRG